MKCPLSAQHEDAGYAVNEEAYIDRIYVEFVIKSWPKPAVGQLFGPVGLAELSNDISSMFLNKRAWLLEVSA